MLNELLVRAGVDGWRPILGALVQPPAPFLLMALIGGLLLPRRRLAGWLLLGPAVLALWFGSTTAGSQALRVALLPPARELSVQQIAALKNAPRTAIVVLGAGRTLLAPEYHTADLRPLGLERLRYAAWLAHQTDLPVLYSGGIGHDAPPGPSEAEIAAVVAERDYSLTLRWLEGRSRDTRENAQRSVILLREQQIEHVVLVTHSYHMARALRNFQAAARIAGKPARITAAPMGIIPFESAELADFLPSRAGFSETNLIVHEWIGNLIGA